MIPLKFEKIHPDALIPKYETEGAAAMDVCSVDYVVIPRGEHRLINTALKVQVPEGYEMQVRSRSGLALKYGLVVLNSPGTVDSDYRGPLGVILANHGTGDYHVVEHQRIAQLVIAAIPSVNVYEGTVDNDTARGKGGFGSTGR